MEEKRGGWREGEKKKGRKEYIAVCVIVNQSTRLLAYMGLFNDKIYNFVCL